MDEKEFETLDDIKEYCQNQGYEGLRHTIEHYVEGIDHDGEGYVLSHPDPDELPFTDEATSAFQMGVVVGTFLEYEYPRYTEDRND